MKKINISPKKKLNRKINFSEINSINENEAINKEDSKYVEEREKQDENNFRLKMDFETEKIENKKKVRKPKFDLNKNIYFNFVEKGEMNACQVRKEPNGDLEYYEPRNEEVDINLSINFMKKPCIRPFNQDEIKVNENYELCENKEENEILPDLYQDDNDLIIDNGLIIDDCFLDDNFDANDDHEPNSNNLIDRLNAIFNENDLEDNDSYAPLNFSIYVDNSTDYSSNPSLIQDGFYINED